MPAMTRIGARLQCRAVWPTNNTSLSERKIEAPERLRRPGRAEATLCNGVIGSGHDRAAISQHILEKFNLELSCSFPARIYVPKILPL